MIIIGVAIVILFVDAVHDVHVEVVLPAGVLLEAVEDVDDAGIRFDLLGHLVHLREVGVHLRNHLVEQLRLVDRGGLFAHADHILVGCVHQHQHEYQQEGRIGQHQPAQKSCFPMFHPLATRSSNFSVFLIVAEIQNSAIRTPKFPSATRIW